MHSTSFHYSEGRSIWLVRLAMGVLLLFVTACSAPTITLKPGEPCPVTPSEPATVLEGGGSPVAGKYPIWLNVPEEGHLLWQLGFNSLSPYEGRSIKQVWAIADDIQGKLRITGKQLDGIGVVLFPNSNSVELVNDTTIKYKEKPMDTLIIDTSSQDHQITSPKPKGYTYFGSEMLYPNPGCYQFTASLAKNTVDIVVEVLDK